MANSDRVKVRYEIHAKEMDSGRLERCTTLEEAQDLAGELDEETDNTHYIEKVISISEGNRLN